MDIQPTSQQPISDDQELAKVLAGVTQQADAAADAQSSAEDADTSADPEEVALPPLPEMPPLTPPTSPIVASGSASDDLDSIKQEALGELRPLVDKLNVSPEEKFDTYLLLLRSTDDKALIGPAHEAARSIADEARRAQALLDVIKEIDYLSGPQAA